MKAAALVVAQLHRNPQMLEHSTRGASLRHPGEHRPVRRGRLRRSRRA